MTLPRKSSRSVSIKGEAFRFHVHPVDRWDPHDELAVYIEKSSSAGHLLICHVHPRSVGCRHIGEKQVEALVQAGLQAGWNPSKLGNFTLEPQRAHDALEDTVKRDRPAAIARMIHSTWDNYTSAHVNQWLKQDPGKQDTAFILTVLRETQRYASELPSRPAYIAQAMVTLTDRYGRARAEKYLRDYR